MVFLLYNLQKLKILTKKKCERNISMTFRGHSKKYSKIRINKTKGRERYGTFNRDSVRRAELREIPIFGGIPVKESVVVTWIIMAVIVGLCIIFVRSLSVENPGKVQLLLESAIGKGLDFFEDIMGKENRKYIPYLITVLIYIGIANIIGLFGFKSPTKDLNVTAALAIMSMCLIEFSGIRKNGFKHWAAHFAKPVPFVAPIMVLEIVIRPLSLCMRLFGNVLGAFVIMELLKAVAPVLIPIPFSFYFDIFDGFLQAYVFVFLTALFMNEEQE